jgi:hypothetical protein
MMKLGDRIRWRISPDPVWRESFVLGEMAYSRDGEVILIGDAVHYLGCPIAASHCERDRAARRLRRPSHRDDVA